MENTFYVLCENSGSTLDGRIALVMEDENYPDHYLMAKRGFRGQMIDKKFCTVLVEPKETYTKEEVDELLNKNTAEITDMMLKKYEGYKSKDEVAKLLNDCWDEAYNQGIASEMDGGGDISKEEWIIESM